MTMSNEHDEEWCDECQTTHLSREEVRHRAEKLDDALKSLMAEHAPEDGMLVTDFALCVEYVGPNGQFAFARIGAQGSADWRFRGLLHEGLREREVRVVMGDEDE